MANLRSDELRAICQVLGISRDGTVPILVLKIRAKLVEMSLVREPQSAASSAYQTPVASGFVTPAPYVDPKITQAPLSGQAPASTQAPTITQAPLFGQAPVAYGGPKIKQRSSIFDPPVIAHPSPPDAPPLTDSDDDIVITVEPM